MRTGAFFDARFAREVADQAWFMDKGVVAERGAPAQMFGAPQYPRLQAFLRRPHTPTSS